MDYDKNGIGNGSPVMHLMVSHSHPPVGDDLREHDRRGTIRRAPDKTVSIVGPQPCPLDSTGAKQDRVDRSGVAYNQERMDQKALATV